MTTQTPKESESAKKRGITFSKMGKRSFPKSAEMSAKREREASFLKTERESPVALFKAIKLRVAERVMLAPVPIRSAFAPMNFGRKNTEQSIGTEPNTKFRKD